MKTLHAQAQEHILEIYSPKLINVSTWVNDCIDVGLLDVPPADQHYLIADSGLASLLMKYTKADIYDTDYGFIWARQFCPFEDDKSLQIIAQKYLTNS